MDSSNIASVILSQLGGKRFIAMTGTKDFIALSPDASTSNRYGLRMTLPRNNSKANRLIVYLNKNDTYTLSFEKHTLNRTTSDFKMKVIESFDDVYVEQLRSIFTQVTGLYTSF